MPIECGLIDGIAVIRIANKPRRNALDFDMFQELANLWARLDADAAVRCVVVGGAGHEAFCSGADLSAHLDRLPHIDDWIDSAMLKSGRFTKPLVAAIQGACVAGGLELALAADIRIAARDARLGLPEVRWGIVPSGGGATRLAAQIGHAHAMDLLLTGRLIDGTEAERIGLVTQSCDAAQVWPVAMERARQIIGNSANAVFATKCLALGWGGHSFVAPNAAERAFVAAVRCTGDAEEGKAAFAGKRTPNYGSLSEGLRGVRDSLLIPNGDRQ